MLKQEYTPGVDHSPVGASAAQRFVDCPGSVVISQGCVDDNDEFSAPGSAAHALSEKCLLKGAAPWNYISWWYHKESDTLVRSLDDTGADDPNDFIQIDKDMADAADIYVSNLRQRHGFKKLPEQHAYVEKEFYCPDLHPMFWGMSDWVLLEPDERVLHIEDYKHGAGIVVEAKWNYQMLYYACGIIHSMGLWDDVDKIIIHIAQPRGFHWAGPIRQWAISIDELERWLDVFLLPAMKDALRQDPKYPDFHTGEHCRFCPARGYQCPGIMADIERIEEMYNEMGGAGKLSGDQLGEFLTLFEVIKIAAKTHRDTAFHRKMAGNDIPGQKLVNSRSNREWNEGTEAKAKKEFGSKAYEPKKLLSPAKMEKLPLGEDFAKRYSSKPDAGLTLVPTTDNRREVSRDTKSLFKVKGKGKKATKK